MTYYDLNMNSKRINNTQDPASAQDVATKNYVDTTIPITNTSGFNSGGVGGGGVFASFTLPAGTYLMSGFGYLDYSIASSATFQVDFYNITDGTAISTYPYLSTFESVYSRMGYSLSQVFTITGTKTIGLRFSHTASGSVGCYGQNSYVRLT
jgi:hypothetical protein